MTRQDHIVAMLLVLAGALLAAWQCWYAYLPVEEALAVDLCRFKPKLLDCFEAFHKPGYGAELAVWVVPVLPAMLGIAFYQVLLCAFAATAPPGHREAWIATARLASFPLSGLAVFVVLNDFAWGGGVTSPSALLLLAASLAMSVLAVLRGWSGVRLAAGALPSAAFLGTAVLLAFFVHGAGDARRHAAHVLRERAAAPPDVRLPAFAPFVPRSAAARLGNPRAGTEVLLFVDGGEASRDVMRSLPRLVPEGDAAKVQVYVIGTGQVGETLLAAQKRGDLRRVLEEGGAGGGTEIDDALRRFLARQEKARERLGVETFPAAVWQDGRAEGTLVLERILRTRE